MAENEAGVDLTAGDLLTMHWFDGSLAAPSAPQAHRPDCPACEIERLRSTLSQERMVWIEEEAKLEAERDKLGNELAQERAKPGGSWDQAAFAQVQEEAERLRHALDLVDRPYGRLREHAEKETRKAAAHAEANRTLVNEYEARLTAMTEYAEACEKDCGRLREQLDVARQALAQIVKAARDASADSDTWDDNGGHVGVGRYQHARVDGLAQAADIARAALGVEGE